MPQAPTRRPPGKQAILKEIYEDNRDGGTPRPARRRPHHAPGAPPPAPRRGPVAAVGLALTLVAVAVVVFSQAGTGGAAPDTPEPAALIDPAPPRPAGDGSNVASVLNLQVRTIVIDPGHGGFDPGAVGPGRLEEKDVTLDVARRLAERLEAAGAYRVILTRDADEAVSLADRVAFANGAEADLYVSVHVNALPDSAIAPVETYYFGVEADATALALAQAENAGSAFSVAAFNAAIRRAGTTVKLQESRELAQSVQSALVAQTGLGLEPRPDWGAKPAPFAVLLHTEAPAILAEITALSNPAEEARLRTPAYRDAIADALEQGILAYLRGSPPRPDDSADAR